MSDGAFDQWMKVVDSLICDELGVGVNDLPDYLWRDAYDDGIAPEDAAEDYIDGGYHL
ncbi:MAG: hypothetical protein KKF27_20025 [Gammaproteobacteria bacterium]|uniref:Uncharacterized protein n=1 Tax=viral metagenome TaxID=1070528 RepID=A0A6M3KY32_9ZZZZ|nr:hypothetical protein [Gammaproteobacteria bacterium]